MVEVNRQTKLSLGKPFAPFCLCADSQQHRGPEIPAVYGLFLYYTGLAGIRTGYSEGSSLPDQFPDPFSLH